MIGWRRQVLLHYRQEEQEADRQIRNRMMDDKEELGRTILDRDEKLKERSM
jgi:hypothetical protein